MSIIIFAIVVILLLALVIWAIGYLTVIPAVPRQIIIALAILLAVVLIAQRAGVF